MTVQNPPIFIEGVATPSEDVRRLWAALVKDQPGLLYDDDLKVTQKSGTPNMSVDIAGGRAFVLGTTAPYQGMYFVENRGTTNKTVTASNPTNPRNDLVVGRVTDAFYVGGVVKAWDLQVVAGTPAAVPADPVVPPDSLALYRVRVNANASSIVDANITKLAKRYDAWADPVQVFQTVQLQKVDTTPADLVGLSISLTTPRPNMKVLVTLDLECENTSTDTSGMGVLTVDGVIQSAGTLWAGINRAVRGRTYLVNLAAAGSHTIKAQGWRSAGTASTFFFTGSTMTLSRIVG